MERFISKLIDQAGDLAQREPVISLFIGAAFLALFVLAFWQMEQRTPARDDVPWRIYRRAESMLWAAILVAVTAAALALLRGYLFQTLAAFQSSHGRVTQANYNAVQTIWGSQQRQQELRAQFYYDEETVERIESEDLTKPAILRKKTVRHVVPGNPFVSARHQIMLRQNPRKKGSALYGGYETGCRFQWKLKNPGERDVQNTLTFPLPAAQSMYDDLSAVLNGVDVLPQMEIKESALVLTREAKAGETLDLTVAFKSRGMSTWYFQVSETREIRDFTLGLTLLDLPQAKLNYPEGCMSPTSIQATPDGKGSALVYRLDHALSNKGMGIALPELPQPGATTNAVLAEIERGWLLVFALLAITFVLVGNRPAAVSVLLTVLFGGASAFGYGFLADFSDLLPGFWAAALGVVLPWFGLLALLLARVLRGVTGRLLAAQFVVYGLLYPSLAGIDPDRQTLYLNVCGIALLCFVAWQLSKRVESNLVPCDVLAPHPGNDL